MARRIKEMRTKTNVKAGEGFLVYKLKEVVVSGVSE